MRHAVQAANLRIHELVSHNPEYRSMETTLSALVIAGAQAYIAHIGDTRIYHWRNGSVRQLTSDHSEAAELVPEGVICLTSALAFHGLTDTIPRAFGRP